MKAAISWLGNRLSRVGFDNVLGYLKGGFESWKNSGKEIDTVHRISPEEFAEKFNENSKVIDVRKEGEYAAEHINDAYSKPLAYINDWVGSMIVDVQQPILLVCDDCTEEETITRLSRVGFDNVLGYLKGGFESWKNSGKEINTIHRISPEEFA